MYNPPVFRQNDVAVLRHWIAQNSFGILVTSHHGQLQATHLPFSATELAADGSWKLVGHMARANSQWSFFDGKSEALVIFSGPHAYVSPTAYATPDESVPHWHYAGSGGADKRKEPALPTWNYVAIHAYGVPQVLSAKREVLERQVRSYEYDWTLESLPSDYLADKETRVVAFEILVMRIEGKAKLGQRQRADERARAASWLTEHETPSSREMAEMMKALK